MAKARCKDSKAIVQVFIVDSCYHCFYSESIIQAPSTDSCCWNHVLIKYLEFVYWTCWTNEALFWLDNYNWTL